MTILITLTVPANWMLVADIRLSKNIRTKEFYSWSKNCHDTVKINAFLKKQLYYSTEPNSLKSSIVTEFILDTVNQFNILLSLHCLLLLVDIYFLQTLHVKIIVSFDLRLLNEMTEWQTTANSVKPELLFIWFRSFAQSHLSILCPKLLIYFHFCFQGRKKYSPGIFGFCYTM